ncbi:hypothetical protein [Gelidibacter sp. F63206]|uniref:hypothetical protein n=1 Tax=Gelidibacter sp. F63206 TaxID=2926425 RepID=UPI001FF3D38C|nr:hypothetical protein [Gelidibacter sp. F63206]MCK0115029.1 hypothetical protein [Gelidibacter sp. F63206]
MAKSTYDKLLKEESYYKDAPKTLSILKQKERYYDSLLTKYRLNEGSIQNILLKSINEFAVENNLKVNSFLEPHYFTDQDLMIKSYQFILEGDYNSIINFVYQLEQKTKFGEIINVNFEKKRNFRTGRDYLQAVIILRSVG